MLDGSIGYRYAALKGAYFECGAVCFQRPCFFVAGNFFAYDRYRRCFTISKKDLYINEEIREKEVRVIDADGSQLGIMPTRQALQIAAEKGLDLVDIAPQATPNV